MTDEDFRWRARTAGTVRGLPIGRGLLGLTITLERSLYKRTDALALQLETDSRDARDWSPVGAYRADGMLRNTEYCLKIVG